ncbi:MAG TPA: lysophospholipid acyltransferase family protein [Treponemataceae bacterium]|jgi:1-acyl-sn-glycerol-3-phosphate acyltransferase|nr:MAG: 1-acyl-sn-glycerol-3-phosphate acyltransferase [Spirochaetes bacterium ADurb.Bin269]TAH55331.1 MAG: 1-acyl-sn-glycerol-3-phosphate acyltransferase [Treponema sp.]HOC28392.1 lysophospholipid acyltransferase family protein [Treponemataceae bacterium]HQL32073.1 lysophospholipid acyltransferase family protein [Treponemataceae bacterium]
MFGNVVSILKFCGYLVGRRKQLKIAKRLDREGNIAERDRMVEDGVASWARYVVGLSGSTVEVSGEEHIPSDTAVVFVGNHQGYLDIPVLLGYVKKNKAFISKIEILKVPYLSDWMKLMQCTFLDRKNMRQSVQAMQQAIETVKKGYSLVIFPEGTRSRGGPVGEFKAGSFKLALKAGVPIVPVTIDGTWRLFEEHNRFAKGHVKVTVHPPVQTAGLSREESAGLPESIRTTIMSALPS